MRKLLQSGSFLIAGIFLFTSCEAWEDESYHEGGPGGIGGGLLLKEVKTTSDGVEGLATYSYDEQGRTKEVHTYSDILDMESYSHTVNTYTSSTNITTVSKIYAAGVVQSTTTMTTQMSGNNVHISSETEYEFGGEIILINSDNDMTFSAPCGVSENIVTLEMPEMPVQEHTLTYEYTDENCSSKEFQDGELTVTTTMDANFSPYTTTESIAMGITPHNPLKIESALDGTIETITYTYNEEGYPTKAVHTFNEGSGQADYTEEFTYY